MLEELFNGYPAVFGERDEEDLEKDERQNDENKDPERDDSDQTKSNAFVWIELIDLVSETQKISWQEVNELSIIEFLNTVSYSIYKSKKKEEAINNYKKNN